MDFSPQQSDAMGKATIARALDIRYLLAAMMGHDELRLQGEDKGDPLVIHTDDPDLVQVIAPMRV